MLTIVIPSYNHEKYIVDCLEAIKKTTLKDLTLLVVDDGSSDGTARLAKEFLEGNPQIKGELIVKKNKGLVDSLNLSMSKIDTRYVYFCASDDVPIMAGVESALNCIMEKDADLVITQGYNWFEETGELKNIYRPAHQLFFEQLPVLSDKEVFDSYVHPVLLQTSIFKVEAIKEVGGWDKDIRYDDYQLFIKFFLRGKYPLYKYDVHSCYYRHHGSNTYKDIPLLLSMKEEVIDFFAPEDARQALKSKEFAYYFLLAVKALDVKLISQLASKIKSYGFFCVWGQVMSLLSKKIRNKL